MSVKISSSLDGKDVDMNGALESQRSLFLVMPIIKEEAPATQVKSYYLKPCCTWKSSTKALLSHILDENLKRISELKQSMELNEATFKLENYQFSKWNKLFLDEPLIFTKIPIHRLDEVDESLSDDELYPPIKEPSALTVDECTANSEKTECVCRDRKNEAASSAVEESSLIMWSQFKFDEEDDDEEMGPPPKYALIKGRSRHVRHIRKNAVVGIQDLLSQRYEKSLQNDVKSKGKDGEFIRSFSDKSMLKMSPRREALMAKHAKNKEH